ncbi:MAG TPA: hypothetical protein VF869_05530 [Jatrophihabitantaceae bacterium]
MTIMMGKLYAALRVANVPEDKAREAAEEVAAFEASLNDLRADMRLIKWNGALNTALIIAVFGVLLRFVGGH